jgi:hypothetical protein
MAFVKNINAWRNKSQSAKSKIRSSASSYVRRKVLVVYKDVLNVSPQWSGNYAYNWTIETSHYGGGQYDPRFKKDPWFTLTPKQAGDPEAIAAAMSWAKDVIEDIKWNTKVSLVNRSPIADEIESGEIKLRPENLIPGGMGIVAYIKTKYSFAI